MKVKNYYIEILSLTNGLVIVYLLIHAKWFLYASILIATTCLLVPAFANRLGPLLDKLVKWIGIVTNAIILGMVFIFVLTPISILYRLFNKKKAFNQTNKSSFFVTRNRNFTNDDFKKQW
jgi:hypothetical protein